MGSGAGWLLGIDTATPWLSLALWHSTDGRSARSDARLDRASASHLMGALDDLLQRHGVEREALSGVGVGVGPGSYTGIRIGIAAALGLGRALSVQVSGSGTLEALAFAALADGERGWVLLDARRERVYALCAQRSGDTLLVEREAALLLRQELPNDALPRYEGHAPDARWHALAHRLGASPEPRYELGAARGAEQAP